MDDQFIPPPPPPPQNSGQPFNDPNAGYQQPYSQQQYDPAQYAGAQPAGQQQQFAQPDPTQYAGDQSPQYPQASAQDPYAQMGYDPLMGQAGQGGGDDPFGDAGGAPPAGAPPPKPSKPANFQLGTLLGPVLNIKVAPHSLQFDQQYFLHLLAGSISLTKDEKIRIVESIPKLKQVQVDELVRIFEEERVKFAELGEEHVPQLEKLAKQHYEDWIDIEMRQQQVSQASTDEAQADEIRKQLGL
ncbi:hypothetical protein KBD59_00240 [Candidatus Gracilibacteria bacterium]|nr:hypothetical protein [Candidatus Gracilibacteria bacterium]